MRLFYPHFPTFLLKSCARPQLNNPAYPGWFQHLPIKPFPSTSRSNPHHPTAPASGAAFPACPCCPSPKTSHFPRQRIWILNFNSILRSAAEKWTLKNYLTGSLATKSHKSPWQLYSFLVRCCWRQELFPTRCVRSAPPPFGLPAWCVPGVLIHLQRPHTFPQETQEQTGRLLLLELILGSNQGFRGWVVCEKRNKNCRSNRQREHREIIYC